MKMLSKDVQRVKDSPLGPRPLNGYLTDWAKTRVEARSEDEEPEAVCFIQVVEYNSFLERGDACFSVVGVSSCTSLHTLQLSSWP